MAVKYKYEGEQEIRLQSATDYEVVFSRVDLGGWYQAIGSYYHINLDRRMNIVTVPIRTNNILVFPPDNNSDFWRYGSEASTSHPDFRYFSIPRISGWDSYSANGNDPSNIQNDNTAYIQGLLPTINPSAVTYSQIQDSVRLPNYEPELILNPISFSLGNPLGDDLGNNVQIHYHLSCHYTSQYHLKIFENNNIIFERIETYQPEYVEIYTSEVCPPNTCTVDCGTHTCCYGNDGIAIYSFLN